MRPNRKTGQDVQVFVISLRESTERRARIKKQLDQKGLDFQFFDAIDSYSHASLLEERENIQKTQRVKGYRLQNTELACFASHRCLWEKCVENQRSMIILEDNVDLKDFSVESLLKIYEQSRDFFYIKLSATNKKSFIKIKKLDGNYFLGQYTGNTCGTTAYIISPAAAKAFIGDSEQFLEPVDDYMEKTWKHGVKTYSVSPCLFERAKISSTIGTFSSRKRKLNITLAKRLYIEAYRVVEDCFRFFFFMDWKKIIKYKIQRHWF